jgi:hypothetical protein
MKLTKENFSLLLSAISIIAVIINMCFTSTDKCQGKLDRAISTVRAHKYEWKVLLDKKRSAPSKPHFVKELHTTRVSSLQRLNALIKELPPEILKESFERRTILGGEHKRRTDNLFSYIDYLRKIEVAHYSTKAKLNVLKTTVGSISDLSNGVLEILNNTSCNFIGSFVGKSKYIRKD